MPFVCVRVRVKESVMPYREQAERQVEPKVCSTGGVIKALRKGPQGRRKDREELITHNMEEELSADGAS